MPHLKRRWGITHICLAVVGVFLRVGGVSELVVNLVGDATPVGEHEDDHCNSGNTGQRDEACNECKHNTERAGSAGENGRVVSRGATNVHDDSFWGRCSLLVIKHYQTVYVDANRFSNFVSFLSVAGTTHRVEIFHLIQPTFAFRVNVVFRH